MMLPSLFFIFIFMILFSYKKENNKFPSLVKFINLFISTITLVQGINFTWLILSSLGIFTNMKNIAKSNNFLQNNSEISKQLVAGNETVPIDFNQCISNHLNLSEFEILLFSLAPIALTWLAVEQIFKQINSSES